MDTIESLRRKLHGCRGNWRSVCADTGLSYWWLIKFAQGRFKEPGHSKIEALQRHFAATEAQPSGDPAKVA